MYIHVLVYICIYGWMCVGLYVLWVAVGIKKIIFSIF